MNPPSHQEPGAPVFFNEPRPPEALGLLALSATLFWGGALLLSNQSAIFLHAVLPLASFLGPALAWSEIRGVERLAFPSSRVSLRGVAGAMGLMAGASLLALVLAALAAYLPGAVKEQAMLRSSLMDVPTIWRFVLFAVLPAFCEESLFRGALLACLRRWGGVRACLTSGLVFAAFHGSPVRFLPVFLLGTALAAVVWLTGNLWLAVAGHAAHNAVVLWGLAATGGDVDLGGTGLALMALTGILLLGSGVLLRSRSAIPGEERSPGGGAAV